MPVAVVVAHVLMLRPHSQRELVELVVAVQEQLALLELLEQSILEVVEEELETVIQVHRQQQRLVQAALVS